LRAGYDGLTYLVPLPADEGALQELRQADNLVDVLGDIVLKGQVREDCCQLIHMLSSSPCACKCEGKSNRIGLKPACGFGQSHQPVYLDVWQDPHAVGVAFRAGGSAKQDSGERSSDRPSAQRKSKGGGKKRGFAGSKR
jgi:hypothetical protein